MDKAKTAAKKLDDAFNVMRGQLDWLVQAVEWQNRMILTLLAQAEVNGGDQSERCDDEGSHRDGGASGV